MSLTTTLSRSAPAGATVDGSNGGKSRGFGPNHRWIVLGIGVASQASFSAAFSGIPSTGPTMQQDYHFTTSQLGWVMGAILFGIAVSEMIWGVITDKWGERPTLLTGLLGTGALLTLLAVFGVPSGGFVPAVGLLIVGMLAVGALGGSVNGSSGRAVMSWFKDGSRGFAMSIRQTAIPAGGALGAVLLPWLATTTSGFHAVFAVLAGFCFVSAAATWKWMHEPEKTETPAGSAPVQRNRTPLARWDVWRLALASGLLSVPQFAVTTFAAVFFVQERHASLLTGSLTLLAVQVGGAAARVWSGRYTDKHGNRRSYVKTIGALTGVALAGATVLTHAPIGVTAAAIALGGLLASAWHGVAYTEVAAMAGADRAGTALGVENTTVFAAASITPVLIPVVLGAASWPMVWAIAGMCALAAIPLAPGRDRAATTSR